MRIEIVRVLKAEFDEEEFELVLMGLQALERDYDKPETIKTRAGAMFAELQATVQRMHDVDYNVHTD